jgi:hypothetical protein
MDTSIDVINKLEQYISSKEKYLDLNPVGVPYWIFAKFNRGKNK